MTKHFFVIGENSTVGRALASQLVEKKIPHHSTTRRASNDAAITFDLTDSQTLPTRFLSKDTVVVMCAGITSVSACKADPKGTERINVKAPLDVAKISANYGSEFILLSTSLVFDGETPNQKSTDAKQPVSIYGHQKSIAEDHLLREVPTARVLRLGKVLSGDNSLFQNWAFRLKQGREIYASQQKRFSPISSATAAAAIITVGVEGGSGIFQLTAARDISYFEAAIYLVDKLKLSRNLVKKQAINDLPGEFIQKHTSLNCDCIYKLGVIPPKPTDALDYFLDKLKNDFNSREGFANRQ
jgi:dTDP-4-dehydrorhamnose reductase